MATDVALRVLMVADVEDDALVAEEALRRGGYSVIAQRVDTAAALDAALISQPWDLILCDYRMPRFSGLDALALVRQRGLDLPFILVSGTIGEETAVAALKAGADDYVMKGNPARLVPSVQRELHASEERRQRRRAEAALHASEERYRSLVETSPDAIALLDLQGGIQMANQQAATLYHHTSPQTLIGHNALEFLVPAERDRAAATLRAVAAGAVLGTHTYTAQRPDGTTFSLELQSTRVPTQGAGSPGSIMIIARDVTERTRAAERLRFQAHLLATVGQAIIATDVAGVITYWNHAAETLYGWAAAEVVGQNILAILSTEPLRAHDAESVASVGGGDPSSGEYLARHRSGRVMPILASAAPVRDDGGAVVGIIGVSTDISARKQAEEALRASEERYRTLVEHLPTVTYVAAPGAEGVPLYVSPQIKHLLGFTVAEWSADPLFWTTRLHPDDHAHVLKARAQFASSGEPLHVECRYRARDGQVVWVQEEVVLVRDAAGQPLHTLGIMLDITARKQAAEATALLASIVAASDDAIIGKALDGTILSWNQGAETMYGYTSREMVGRSISLLVPPDRPDDVPQILARLRLGETLDHYETVRACKDGRLIAVSLTISPIRDAHGQIVAASTIARDITAHQAAKEALRTHGRQQGAVAALGQRALAAPDLDTLLQATTALLAETLQVECCSVFELLPDGATFLLRAGIGWQRSVVGQTTMSAAGASMGGYVLLADGPVITEDLRDERRFQAPQLHEEGIVSGMSVVVGGTGQAFGALGVFARHARTFSADDVSFVQAAANVLAQALQHTQAQEAIHRLNVELEQRVVERTAQLEAAIGDLHGQIAERHQAEAALRTSELHFRSVTQSAHDAIVAADATGTIIAWNSGAQTLFGYTEAEMLGRPLTLLMPERYRAAHLGGLARFLATGEAHVVGHSVELHGLRRDGSEFPLELSLATWSTGDSTFFSGILRDLTNRKRTEAALQQAKEEAERANAAKSEFLARMSHELRTPLNAILGFGQLLEMRDLGPRGDEGVGHILKAGRHLLGLIDEVLDISRIEAGRLTLSIEPIDVVERVGQVLDLARPLAATRHIGLVNEVTPLHGWHLLADQQRLTQVLLNLVANAIKYNREGGQVTVSGAVQDGARLRLLVRDSGAGLHPADLARLFVPFERLGAAQSDIEGTGIGLALARRLMDAMGGTIGVDSVVGEGSTFWVELPLAESPVAQQRRPSPIAASAAEALMLSRSCTVLYVEDNLSNIALIEHLLSQVAEVRLLTALQGSLGLELAREHQPDLILLDVHLPDMRGDEVLRRLQADPQTRDIPVVVLSADAVPSHIARLREAGAAAYLTKPLDVKQFLQTIRAVLG